LFQGSERGQSLQASVSDLGKVKAKVTKCRHTSIDVRSEG
jgi:hypothetical protein